MNGFLSIACMLLDCGCISPLLWSFEEREKIMLFLDLCCGCRMHCAFVCFLGLVDDFTFCLIDFLCFLLVSVTVCLVLIDFVLVGQRILFLRLRGVACVGLYDFFWLGLSGCFARCVGIVWDLRLIYCYEIYFLLVFDICFCVIGDALDRFFCRLFDLRMCVLMLRQLFFFCFDCYGFLCLFDYLYVDIQIEYIILIFYSI